MGKEKKYLGHIESLRALAALMVLVFHFLSFEGVHGFLITNETIRTCSKFGAQGVELFYIISGFVIYYSLTNASFGIQNYPKYLLKRFARIFPPFLGTILLICLVALLWKGNYPYTAKQVLENATLSVDVFNDSEWMNPIFVTLKVEFLFYLIIGFLIIVLRRHVLIYSSVLVAALGSVFFFHSTDLVHNIPFFVAGICCSEIYKSRNQPVNYVLLGCSLLVLYVVFPAEDLVVCIIGIVLILWLKIRSRALEWTGAFSYSLYLTHGLSGGLFLYLTKNEKYLDLNSWLALVLAIGVALTFAYGYYRIIEKHAIRWSKHIKY
ncbi:acyltransferase family protein [Fluviicola chungangensis]|uniref:Acyltransferase n=1 Tax=Fluviicola chungangensis TaxID=2597671 RepID=A0A556N313_9FLAO|nr:acyltransferase [Fluviicola chungangensis]TSJ46541.1 acyltransferase [Fluviicola chungangensis]